MGFPIADVIALRNNPATNAAARQSIASALRSPRVTVPPELRERSVLELNFIRLWELAKGPALAEEFRFHPTRLWRADFCHEASKTLFECEGKLHGGRHTRPAGFTSDCLKYLEAQLLGYRVYRLPAALIRGDIVQRLIEDCKNREVRQ